MSSPTPPPQPIPPPKPPDAAKSVRPTKPNKAEMPLWHDIAEAVDWVAAYPAVKIVIERDGTTVEVAVPTDQPTAPVRVLIWGAPLLSTVNAINSISNEPNDSAFGVPASVSVKALNDVLSEKERKTYG